MTTGIQIVFDAISPARLAAFWIEALGYRMEPPPASFDSWDDWARAEGIPEDRWDDARAIDDPGGGRPRIYFQRVPEGKMAKNRVHLDLNVSGSAGVPLDERKTRIHATVERLKALGATDERGAMEQRGEYWVRMNDPEGNEFCVQ